MRCITCQGPIRQTADKCDWIGCKHGDHPAFDHVSIADAATCPDYADPMPTDSPEMIKSLTGSTYVAAITTINERQPRGWFDTIRVFDANGEVVDAIKVESSEDPEPYDRALTEAGWIITGPSDVQHVHGGDGWTLTKSPMTLADSTAATIDAILGA